jgi:hypothetical protein
MLGKPERIAELRKRHDALRQVIKERQVWYQDHPIGSSGLCIGRYKIVGRRDAPVLVEVFTFDRGLLRELRAIEKQMFIEAGGTPKGPSKEDELKEVIRILNGGRDRVANERKAQLAREGAERPQNNRADYIRRTTESSSTENSEE